LEYQDKNNGVISSAEFEERSFKSLFERNPDPVFAIDLNGRFILVNEAASILFKCSGEEMKLSNFTNFVDSEDQAVILKRYFEAKSGSSFDCEIKIVAKNGDHLFLDITNVPIVVDGKAHGIFCIAKDITQRKFQELENYLIYNISGLFSSDCGFEECLFLMLKEICSKPTFCSHAEVWIPNPNNGIVHRIAKYECIIDGDRSLKFQDSTIHEIVDRSYSLRKTILNNEKGNSFDKVHIVDFTGIAAIPVFFRDEIIAILLFQITTPAAPYNVLDLSEKFFNHIAGDIQRKKSEEEVNRFFSYSPDMLFVAGRDGYLRKINETTSKSLGYPTEYLLSQPYNMFIHPEDRVFVQKKVGNLSETNPTIRFENRYITSEGHEKWVEWTLTSLHTNDLIYGVGRDITDAKKLQKIIESERKRFSDMFYEAPVTMCILKGAHHIFESANDLYYKFSGRNDLIGKSVREVFPEAEGQGIFELMDQVYNEGKSFSINERFLQLDVNGDGFLENFYLSFMFQPYRDEDGQVKGIFYFGVDVTEQVVARKKLEDSQKLYVDLIQNLPVAVYTVNRQGELLLYNKAAINLWGREPVIHEDKWCGSWKIYSLEGELVPHSRCPMAVAIRERRPVKSEIIVIKRPDGTIKYVLPFPSPIFDSNGEMTGGINVLVDITEKKKDEEELKKLSLIARKTINAVIITNAEGEIEWVNDAFTKITEYEFAEVEGKKSSILHGKHTDPGVVKFMQEMVGNQKPFECEILKYTKSKRPIWIKIEAQPIFDNNGNLIHYFDIETDITENKSAYERLVKTENEIRKFAGQLNHLLEEERGRIAREIHDEFGQQLTGLKMSLYSLKGLIDKQQKPLEIISDMMIGVESTIQSLRNFSTDLRPGILDTLGLVPSIEWLAKEFEKKSGLQIVWKNYAERNIFDKTLSITFFRVCQEALTNVVKHSDADKVIIEMKEDRNWLSLKVEDNGNGIQTEKLEDPFSMGLIGMRERANLIGAQLKVLNAESKGTKVELIVKLHD
jgi:PAS domain S-box-containing protein